MDKVITLSGWAQPHDALEVITPGAIHMDYAALSGIDALFDQLAKREPRGVVAWSLGAQLAVRAVQKGVIQPEWMVLLAPPLQFVSSEAYNAGMDPLTYAQFRESYRKGAGRTARRFHALLVKGDARADAVKQHLSHHEKVENTACWLPWLDELAACQHHHFNDMSLPKTLIVQGKQDAIVPPAQAGAWKALFPDIELKHLEGAAHAPHLHDPQRVSAWVSDYYQGVE